MADLGSPGNPLRVAVIGAGPAGFYAVSELLKHTGLHARIDMFDQLPTPFGLVRYGVAPDHPKDKSVARTYDRTAQSPHYRFFGNVRFGEDLSLEDLQRHFHQVVFTTGAQSDRHLDIPGEELSGNHSAAEFVAWYNGHPDFVDRQFDLSQENVAVVGMGNVALDVARILCRTPAELESTDIAGHALQALRAHRVRNVYIIGRRGPAQAAFTPAEIRELGNLTDTDVHVAPDEAALDALSAEFVARHPDRNTGKNIACIQEYAANGPSGAARTITLRFLVSPIELSGEAGRLTAVRLAGNRLSAGADGAIRAEATGDEEVLPLGMVFRSVGYRGLPLPGVPFDPHRGVIPNQNGRITDAAGRDCPGLYAAGWIKRGPTGVIGTNKTCARETVACMLEDVAAGNCPQPVQADADALERFVRERCGDVVTYADWQKIDRAEIDRGRACNRPRVKFTSTAEMVAAAKRV